MENKKVSNLNVLNAMETASVSLQYDKKYNRKMTNSVKFSTPITKSINNECSTSTSFNNTVGQTKNACYNKSISFAYDQSTSRYEHKNTFASQQLKDQLLMFSDNKNSKLEKNENETNKPTAICNYQTYNRWRQVEPSSKMQDALKFIPITDSTITNTKDLPLDINCFDVPMVQHSMLNMLQIGIEKSSDFITCRRFLASAINKPTTILTQLVLIIESLKSLDLCTSALRSLYKIILFASYQKRIPTDDIFYNFNNLTLLIDALASLQAKFEDCKRFNEVQKEWHVKILHILEILSIDKHWKNKLKYLKKSSLEFIGKLVANKSTHVDLVNHLLVLIKVICVDKINCQVLSCREFYLGLCDAFNLTHKINTITDIFQYFMRIKTISSYLQQRDEVLSLFIDMISFNTGKFVTTKRKIMDMLYKLSFNNDTVVKILQTDDYFLKLLFYFTRKGKVYEYNSQIKALSLLNRSLKRIRLNDEVVNLGFTLPACCIPNLNESKSSDDDESDESDEEGAEGSDINVKSGVKSTQVDESLKNVSPFFIELLEFTTLENVEGSTEKNCKRRIRQKCSFEKSDIFTGKVFRLDKINQHAYPDAVMIDPVSYNEIVVHPKCDSSTSLLSQKLRSLRSGAKPKFFRVVVFNLDVLYKRNAPFQIMHPKTFALAKPLADKNNSKLIFESRFECGNLRKATQVEHFEYELYLSPDTYTTKGFQWFYFEVANMEAGVEYTFNIINFSKSKVLYMEGMRPLMFSVFDHQASGVGWKRTSGKVIYYSNHYTNKTDQAEYKTLSFSVTFPHSFDNVYFAYHYPYTYSRLRNLLAPLNKFTSEKIYLKLDKLCNTINNFNEVPLLTITAKSALGDFGIPYNKRPIIFLTGRVHPGESNSSWIMEGIIKFLLNVNNTNAEIARNHYIFKIVPMLNPEGVIYGNTRRGLTGIDLNRCWIRPNKDICPEIYYTKRLVAFAKKEIKHPIAAFIDIHGHSRKKFFFLYGCNPKLSWNRADKKLGDRSEMLTLIPNAIHTINSNMQVDYCQNQIMRNKESTARVVFWRQFNIRHSYTLECTYSEIANKLAICTKALTEIGSTLVTAFGNIARHAFRSKRTIASLSLDYGEWVTREDIQNEQFYLSNDRNAVANKTLSKKETLNIASLSTGIPLKFGNGWTTMAP